MTNKSRVNSSHMHIFCDGSCKNNGQKGAVGGWAFACWTQTPSGEPATAAADRLQIGPKGEVPTNQRAELKALLEALQYAQSQLKSVIYTDSLYSLNCTTKWGPAWKKAGWTRSSGEPLQNLDLIKPLVDLYGSLKARVEIRHVRGHQTNSSAEAWGNNWVDRAAVAGSQGIRLTATTVAEQVPVTPVTVPTTPLKPPVKVLGQTDLRSWFS
jgi:ribonuclease HI